jgi:hypothetical protein
MPLPHALSPVLSALRALPDVVRLFLPPCIWYPGPCAFPCGFAADQSVLSPFVMTRSNPTAPTNTTVNTAQLIMIWGVCSPMVGLI